MTAQALHAPNAPVQTQARSHHLPLGFFEDPRKPPRVLHILGERLASQVHLRTVTDPLGRPGVVSEHLTLYACPFGEPYVVHSILERHDTSPPMLGVVQRYASWKEMSTAFPTLAQRASNKVGTGPPVEEHEVRDALRVVDPTDPAYAFG